MCMVKKSLKVEVCYGLLDKQMIIPIEVPADSTAYQAIIMSNIQQHFPEIDLEENPLGIFSKKVKPSYVLRDGDRIEIYRPLVIDPKLARRRKVVIPGKAGI